MDPWGVFGESVQEFGCGDGAALAAAGVLDVANVAADLVVVFVAERQAPEFFAGDCKAGLRIFRRWRRRWRKRRR